MVAGQYESANETLAGALASWVSWSCSLLRVGAYCLECRTASSCSPVEKPATDLSKRAISQTASGSIVDVLLVEDDPNERALFKSLLEMEGYRVQTACNGNEAIRCLSHFAPQFVLLDMMMPECDGRETLHRIRQLPAYEKLPIFAVSVLRLIR